MNFNKPSSYVVERTPPQNIKKKDLANFQHELKRKFSSPKILMKKNVYVHQQKLWKYKYFNAFSNHWRMSNFWIRHKINLFIKNLITALNFENDIKYEVIPKASWVIDQKSWKYMHWFSDALQRIEFIEEFLNDYPVILFKHYENFEYIEYTLKKLEIPFLLLDREKYYLVDELLISTHVAPSGNYNEKIINNIATKLRDSQKSIKTFDKTKYERVWVSRQNTKIRRESNFKDIKNVLDKYNFKIVVLEDLKYFDQVNIFLHTKILAGIQGAGLINMLFMKKGTKIIEVRSASDNKNNCYFSLASALKINYFYSHAHVNENYGGSHSGDYKVDVVELEKNLLNIINKN